MNSEEKLVQGLKLVVEAFAEMINEKNSTLNSSISNVVVEKTPDKTFKLNEAAEYLQVTRNMIYTLARQGKIKHFRAGNRYLFRKCDLDEWIKEETEKSIVKEKHDNQYGKLRKITE